jgi:hypothetical protein
MEGLSSASLAAQAEPKPQPPEASRDLLPANLFSPTALAGILRTPL